MDALFIKHLIIVYILKQVSTYSVKGLKTTYVSGEVTDKSVLDEVSQGNFQLVFFTPEMLIGSKRWRSMLTGDLYSERLKAFFIDEAHCVKKWYTSPTLNCQHMPEGCSPNKNCNMAWQCTYHFLTQCASSMTNIIEWINTCVCWLGDNCPHRNAAFWLDCNPRCSLYKNCAGLVPDLPPIRVGRATPK